MSVMPAEEEEGKNAVAVMSSPGVHGHELQPTNGADGPAKSLDRVRIGELLVSDGILTSAQLQFALRVQQKLRYHERLGKVIEELNLVDPNQLRRVIQKHRRSLSIPEILLDLGLLQPADLEEAERTHAVEPERPVEALLLANRVIDEKSFTRALSEKLGVPMFVPRMDEIDAELLMDGSLADLKRLRILPLRRSAGSAGRAAVSDPRDPKVARVVEALFGDAVDLLLATPGQISAALEGVEVAQRASRDSPNAQAQIVELLDDIVARGHSESASDIHIEPSPTSVRVRFRIDGLLSRRFEFPKSVHGPLISRIKVLAEADIAERRRHQGGRMIVNCGGQELDVRVSFYVSIHGETAVLRILSRREGLLGLPSLGFAPAMFQRYTEDVVEPETGIVVLTGPTGSGKTTTLSSSIASVNRSDNKIITAEDPVEYQIDGVTQCQINPQIGLTYDETLRAIVRQDPDIIVLGEIRDGFSANVAIQAALTGHKVFTTFHTADSVGALLRLINMDVKPFFIATTVRGVVAQRLVRRTCSNCSQPYSPSQDEIRRSGLSARDARRFEFVRGAGCANCAFTGYRGRVAFFELLVLNEAVNDQLMSNPTGSIMRQVALETAGLVTLREEGVAKSVLGLTTLEEVYRHTPRVEKMRDVETILSVLGYR